MRIATIALHRPYIFVVLALLILIAEKNAQTDVSNVEHIESQSLNARYPETALA